MAFEIHRRNLLKAFMATAGVAAVGIDFPIAIVDPSPSKVEDFDPEHGDIWIHKAGRNFFIGKSIRISPEEPEVINISSLFDPEPRYISGQNPGGVDVDFLADVDGMRKVHECLIDGNTCDIAFGMRPGYVFSQDCIIRTAMADLDGNPFVRGSFTFARTKPFIFTSIA